MEQGMSRSCVCGGRNENCRYCGGRGSLPDNLASALESRLQRRAFEEASRSKRPRQTLVSHRILVPSKTPTAPDSRILVPCPEGCGASINPRNLNRHLRKVHGNV